MREHPAAATVQFAPDCGSCSSKCVLSVYSHDSNCVLSVYSACRFFSSLIQRSAQVHRRLGGGSMTLLAILPGQPAKGERQPAATAEDYPNLTPSQRDKLLAALAKRQPPVAETLPGCVNTEVRSGAGLAACGCCWKTGSSVDSGSGE